MKISDFIEQQPEVEEVSSLDLSEVEKTAELLEALSEEDTFPDELAKLAMLSDMALAGFEKDASAAKYLEKFINTLKTKFKENNE